MFIDRPFIENEIYVKLLFDKLLANLWYLYENLAAQIINSTGRELYYQTWSKENITHYYEIDFLVSIGSKIDVFEVKSSGISKHDSINAFAKNYSDSIKIYICCHKKIFRKNVKILVKHKRNKLMTQKLHIIYYKILKNLDHQLNKVFFFELLLCHK